MSDCPFSLRFCFWLWRSTFSLPLKILLRPRGIGVSQLEEDYAKKSRQHRTPLDG